MLVAKTCPHTGVVNLFQSTDPHMAIGSIVAQTSGINHGAGYVWWCHTVQGRDARGTALDVKSAQACMASQLKRTVQ